jgi:hypothetical protein
VIAAQSWLLIGVFLSLGHMTSAVVSWMGGTGELVIILALIAAMAGLGAWCLEWEDLANIRAEELAAEPLPQDGPPLTADEHAVIDAIETAETFHQTRRSSQ